MAQGRRGDVDMSGALSRVRNRKPQEAPAGRDGGEADSSAADVLGRQAQKKRRNRKKTGKRSNPDWTLASCYVEKKVYWAAKEALAVRQRELGRKVDYSELVNRLLREWCEEQGIDIDEG